MKKETYCPFFREEQGDLITIVFDCRNAGLKNMDMEFIQFIIGIHQVILFTAHPPLHHYFKVREIKVEVISYTRIVLLYGFFQFFTKNL